MVEKKGRATRSKGALRLLGLASAAKDPVKKQHLLENALLEYQFGKYNENRNYHLGRPKGPKRETTDKPALEYMDKVSKQTGEERPYTLARIAVCSGMVSIGNIDKTTHIKRLGTSWKKRQKVRE